MLKMFRYYWTATKGYRLNPWNSPYIRWRFETFLGQEAANLNAAKFLRLSWKYRVEMEHFLNWAEERRKAQRQHD